MNLCNFENYIAINLLPGFKIFFCMRPHYFFLVFVVSVGCKNVLPDEAVRPETSNNLFYNQLIINNYAPNHLLFQLEHFRYEGLNKSEPCGKIVESKTEFYYGDFFGRLKPFYSTPPNSTFLISVGDTLVGYEYYQPSDSSIFKYFIASNDLSVQSTKQLNLAPFLSEGSKFEPFFKIFAMKKGGFLLVGSIKANESYRLFALQVINNKIVNLIVSNDSQLQFPNLSLSTLVDDREVYICLDANCFLFDLDSKSYKKLHNAQIPVPVPGYNYPKLYEWGDTFGLVHYNVYGPPEDLQIHIFNRNKQEFNTLNFAWPNDRSLSHKYYLSPNHSRPIINYMNNNGERILVELTKDGLKMLGKVSKFGSFYQFDFKTEELVEIISLPNERLGRDIWLRKSQNGLVSYEKLLFENLSANQSCN